MPAVRRQKDPAMSAHPIAQIQIHERERVAAYTSGFMDIFAKYNGKLLAVDEAPQALEGEWAFTRTVLLRFPSKDDADSWYHSDEYQELAQHRYAASEANIVMVKGLGGDA